MKSSFKNMFLVLTCVCVVASGLLAGVNQLTKSAIEAANKAKQVNAIKAVLPEFDNDPIGESYMITDANGDSLRVFPAKKNNETVGMAVETFSDKGFGGNITLMVGFDKSGAIINYQVLNHKETPGLGSKMEEWFHAEKNSQCVLGKVPGSEGLKVSKKVNTEGYVDAITAATISSRAFVDAINKAYISAFKANDGSSGATPQKQSYNN